MSHMRGGKGGSWNAAMEGCGMTGGRHSMHGFFLTFDVAVSMLLIFTLITIASYYFTQAQSGSFPSQVVRNYVHDAAGIMASQGYFGQPLAAANDSDTSGIRGVMRALPNSICMSVEAYGTAVPPSLSGYWKMDEDNGYTAADYSGNSLTGVLIGQPNYTQSGRAGGALAFGGSDEANVSDAFELNPYNESFSISAWIDANPAQAATARIFSKLSSSTYPGYSLSIRNSDGKAVACYHSIDSFCNDGGTTVVSDANVSGAGWKHIAAVFNRANGSVYMYVDAVLQATVDTGFAAAAQINNTAPASIGGEYSGGVTNGFKGTIDEVRFYRKALTASEVAALYSNSRNLLYAVTRGNCTSAAGGEVQSYSVPFQYDNGQDSDAYGTAVIRAWRRGAS